MREHTKVIKIGGRVIGGGNPILIQSMTNTKTENVAGDGGADSGADSGRLRHYPLRGSNHGGSGGAWRD